MIILTSSHPVWSLLKWRMSSSSSSSLESDGPVVVVWPEDLAHYGAVAAVVWLDDPALLGFGAAVVELDAPVR